MTRIKRSMRLINSTDMSITEIAAQTGFSSTSRHYIRFFKAVTGKTPLKYRDAERTHGIRKSKSPPHGIVSRAAAISVCKEGVMH